MHQSLNDYTFYTTLVQVDIFPSIFSYYQTCNKFIFVREPDFDFKNVWTIFLETLSRFRVMRVNMRVLLV